ncbi:TonB-dependent receptor [Sphingomonas sp. I4]
MYALATGQADASLFYTVNKQFKIGLQVQNLLDATTRTTFVLNQTGLEAPRTWFKSDRQFQLSVRLTY